jgi:hypothetical protein
MRAYNRSVDHHVFVIVVARQQLENALENAALGPSAVALIDDLPIAEALRQVAPRDTRPISIQNRIDKQSIVGRGATNMALAPWQKILDPIPLVVA